VDRGVAAGTLIIVATVAIVAPAGSTHARAVTEVANGRILFTAPVGNRQQIFSMDPDGSDPLQLTHLRAGVGFASATADGKRIAFDYRGAIWVMNADGAKLRRISPRHDGAYDPDWSPDGTRIAYEGDTSRGFGIVVMNADGSGRELVAAGGIHYLFLPDWSPDGRMISFTKGGHRASAAIFTVDVATKLVTKVPIVFSPDTVDAAAQARWSPDGTRFVLAAETVRDGKPICPRRRECIDLYTVASTGGVPTRLTNDRVDHLFPIWSPDGQRVAFGGDSHHGGCSPAVCSYDVYTMRADGSGVRRLTHGTGGFPTAWMG
jgi:Tol biopolymer transport system component